MIKKRWSNWNAGKDYTERSAQIELKKAKSYSKQDNDGLIWEIVPIKKTRYWEDQRYEVVGYKMVEGEG